MDVEEQLCLKMVGNGMEKLGQRHGDLLAHSGNESTGPNMTALKVLALQSIIMN